MSVNLWIDDLRPPLTNWIGGEWIAVTTSQDALNVLENIKRIGGSLGTVAFDHDLGGDDTSRPVMRWIVDNELFPEHVALISMNPVGVRWMRETVEHDFPAATKLDLWPNGRVG